jgi:hypothetical protein
MVNMADDIFEKLHPLLDEWALTKLKLQEIKRQEIQYGMAFPQSKEELYGILSRIRNEINEIIKIDQP